MLSLSAAYLVFRSASVDRYSQGVKHGAAMHVLSAQILLPGSRLILGAEPLSRQRECASTVRALVKRMLGRSIVAEVA